MFDDLLKTIFNETVNESNSNTKNETVNESNSSTKNETVNESNSSTKNKTVNESNSSTKNESKSDNKSNYESDYESDNEGDNLTNKDENYYKIKQLNNWFETIDQTKSLEEQIEILKTKDFLYEYWSLKYYNDNKDLNYKIFKAKAAYLLIDLNKQIFEKIYGCNFMVLVEKLISTIDKKEENQIIIDDIKNKRSKFFKEYKFEKDVIKHSGNLDDAVKIILEINKVLISGEVDDDDNDDDNLMI